MRILLCIGSMRALHGGPPRVIEGLAQAIADQGAHVSILTDDAHYSDIDFQADWPQLANNPQIHLLPKGAIRGAQTLCAQFDYVHFHGVWDVFFLHIARLCRRARCPYFISPHGCLDPWSLGHKALKKWIGLNVLGYRRFLNKAAAIFYATAEELGDAASLRLKARALVSTNGVAPRPDSVSPQAHLPEQAAAALAVDIRFVFFSRIHRKKGIDLFAQAFARVAKDIPHISLSIVGIAEDAQLKADLEDLANISPRIFFTTDLVGPSARAVLQQCTCFVLPTLQEGFSIAALEAMADGLPILVTPACRLSQALEQGAGWQANPDVADWMQIIRQIAAETPGALALKGQAGKSYVTTYHNWGSIARDLIAAYSSATKCGSKGAT